ncbi:MAG: ATP synthase F1 subunit epsilon [Actinomycetota bacterium]
MATPFSVSVVTPEESVYEGEAELVVARSPEGEFGIMAGHIPFLAALVPGIVTVVSGSSRESFLVTGGFLEASGPHDDYHAIVLADDAEAAGEMDAARARELIEEARRKREEDADQRGEAELRVAMAGPELGRD